eukprot:jgi/Psemu1/63803/estExt_Genemark1.C_380014
MSFLRSTIETGADDKVFVLSYSLKGNLRRSLKQSMEECNNNTSNQLTKISSGDSDSDSDSEAVNAVSDRANGRNTEPHGFAGYNNNNYHRMTAAILVGIVVGMIASLDSVSSFHPETVASSMNRAATCNSNSHRRRHTRHQRHRCDANVHIHHALGQDSESIAIAEPESRLGDTLQQPWTTAIVDYSGVNEYVEAHYRKHPSLQTTLWKNGSGPFFSRGGVSDARGAMEERIYNARELMGKKTETEGVSNSVGMGRAASLGHRSMMETYGMTLVNSPTAVTDWRCKQEIEEIYIRELETILPSLFSSNITMHCFWNPMLRGEKLELSPPRRQRDDSNESMVGAEYCDKKRSAPAIPTANVASMVHIDTDVGAYASLDDFLAIVETNRVRRGQRDEALFDRNEYEVSIRKDRKRFAVVNFWRNTNRAMSVTNRPLAILSTRYNDIDDDNGNGNIHAAGTNNSRARFPAFPYRRPDMERSKWYSFPNMTNDELLVFYQYDRAVTQPSDLFHCAISTDGRSSTRRENNCDACPGVDSFLAHERAPRESFDIRALVVFDEVIPPDKDRFHPERIRPVLSFEESGCFCDEQGLARTNNNNNFAET